MKFLKLILNHINSDNIVQLGHFSEVIVRKIKLNK
jgi:hypothetical protein